ncbi:MAG: ABC transporter permease [Kiritimatiellae bacterium]|nr:ABC transporter permease [Kiritimatiellia bacterium]
MILRLMLRGLRRGKARFLCAVLGIAAAVGAVVFTFSLTATNAAQAPALAKRATAPWAAWRFDGIRMRFGRGQPPPREDGERPGRRPEGRRGPRPDLKLDVVATTIDYRPGGRVLQGPPMMAVIAAAPQENPYGCTQLVEGRWPDATSSACEFVCTKNTLVRFGRGVPPPVGTDIKFVGEKGTLTAKVVGYLAEAKLPMGWPGVFANPAAFAVLKDETHGTAAFWKKVPEHAPDDLLTAESEQVVRAFTGDEARRMDYARPLLFAAAILTALCLLVNSLLLAVESNRRVLATLRTVGLTRGGVLALVTIESLFATGVGWLLGCLGGIGALVLFVAADPVAFPVGPTFAWGVMGSTGAIALVVAFIAVLFALRPALAVRPFDVQDARPHRRRRGMAIAFACGFAAFVAVEVWGASLMRAFVPSEEWPDAIVSILPGGVSSFDVEKLRKIPGVKRISELMPLQLNFDPEEPMEMPGGRGGPGKPCRNALFLAAEWLPEFKFIEGTWAEATNAVFTSDACVITEMMSRARKLHKGDKLRVAMGGRGPKTPVELPIAGVVDLNWHMVTSRGLVRGLNRAPVMTDGPVFVSFDTLEVLDARPAPHVKMTHLWVEYEPEFLKEKGVFPAGREVEKSIAHALGLDPSNPNNASTVRLHARDEIADGTLAHGSDLIGQAARVPFVFLAILAIGFIAMLVADADAAKREFAVLRAVGATKGQLTLRLARGALRTAFWGIVCGLPVGALVGWLFSLSTGAVWPGLPHYFVLPVRVVLEGAFGAIVFALAFALPSAYVIVRRAARR